jgi:hypothetical protein
MSIFGIFLISDKIIAILLFQTKVKKAMVDQSTAHFYYKNLIFTLVSVLRQLFGSRLECWPSGFEKRISC